MAIVKMKRLTLLAPVSDREKLMKALQRMGAVEIETPADEVREYVAEASRDVFEIGEEVKRLKWALGRLGKYDTDDKISFGVMPEIEESAADAAAARAGEIGALVSKLEYFERRLGELKSAETRVKAARAQYEPWAKFDAARAALMPTRDMRYCAGAVPARALPALEDALRPLAATAQVVSAERETALVVVAAHAECEKEALAALDDAGFERENFEALGDKTPAEYLAFLNGEADAIAAERGQIESDTAAMAGDIRDIKILIDLRQMDLERAEASARVAQTESVFLLRGWTPAEIADRVAEKIAKISPAAALELSDPLPEEEPPVRLQNGRLASPYENIVEGYSLPAYRGIDPTAVMAPFYACLFGMMLSDAGYGLIMALAIPLFIRKKGIKRENAKLLWVLFMGGLATIVWGLVYNTIFGFNWLPRRLWLLDSVGEPLLVMGICIGMGAIHLFAGLGVAAHMNIKRGDPLAAIWDQFSWIMVLCGLGLMFLPGTAMIGQYTALAGALIILLMAARDRKNPLKRLIGGLSALYGISSWLSDLLSYLRLFGMGLATGVIGMVFNQLIGMIWGGGIIGKVFAVVLFVFCHGFNLGINALGAYVHACRLQYVEFFGKFYEEGGKAFKPLSRKTRYVSIRTPQGET